ncbi:MAG: PqiC family protein [Rubrivivax sp.]
MRGASDGPGRLRQLAAGAAVPPARRAPAGATLPTPAPGADAVQLLLPVRLPDYLDREAILLPQGTSGLLALSGHRWAESLRDAVPRVLQQDLAAHLGEGRVWTAPLPPALVPARQLRVEFGAFEVDTDRSGVRLDARWTWIDAQGRTPPRALSARLRVPAGGASIDALVDAHRLALWQLAARIAAAR